MNKDLRLVLTNDLLISLPITMLIGFNAEALHTEYEFHGETCCGCG